MLPCSPRRRMRSGRAIAAPGRLPLPRPATSAYPPGPAPAPPPAPPGCDLGGGFGHPHVYRAPTGIGAAIGRVEPHPALPLLCQPVLGCCVVPRGHRIGRRRTWIQVERAELGGQLRHYPARRRPFRRRRRGDQLVVAHSGRDIPKPATSSALSNATSTLVRAAHPGPHQAIVRRGAGGFVADRPPHRLTQGSGLPTLMPADVHGRLTSRTAAG
jgi:hypothetical protein